MITELDIYQLVGQRIKTLREQKKMTQRDLGDLVDMEQNHVSRLESGRTNLTIKNIFRISQALGVKMKDLVDVEDFLFKH